MSEFKVCPEFANWLWDAGLVLKQSSSDKTLFVDLHTKLHIVCRGSIAAFQNSELSTGDSTQSIAALLAAVATVSSAKAVEIQKLVAASQKVWSRLEPHACHAWKALWSAAAVMCLQAHGLIVLPKL